MTPDFTETLKLFLTISKISGLINFCCTLESGLLFRDTRLTYHLFLEGLRMFVYLICTYHICYNMGFNYIFLQFNVIKYWCIVIAARMSEKWIIRFINGIIEFDRKMLIIDSTQSDVHFRTFSKTFWTVMFAVSFLYIFVCQLNYMIYGTLPNLELSHYTNFLFQSPEIIVFVVMLTSCYYLSNLGHRFCALNELWKCLQPGLMIHLPDGWTSSETTVLVEHIRLLHADLSELMRLFSLGYGPVLLVYFIFTFFHAVLETFLIAIFRDYKIKIGFIPFVFYMQYIINMTSIIFITSWVIEKVKMFMDQVSVYESNELTAFGFFSFDLKLMMSILVLLITAFSTMLQLKDHPSILISKNIIVLQFHKPSSS